MGHVILLSELERARPARLRGPLPEGGATISLFLGVRYDRVPTARQVVALAEGALRDGEPHGESQAQPSSASARIDE
jgi:hypothetical protein